MVEFKLTPEMVQEAKLQAETLGALRGSITHGDGNVYGFVGEMIVANYIGATIAHTYDYDLIKDGVRFDVKTKRCTSKPLDTYFCSVSCFNTRQDCDYYTFVRVMEDFSLVWILGSIRKHEFYEKATFYRKGEIDPSSTFGWRFKDDCYNLPVSMLRPFQRMVKK